MLRRLGRATMAVTAYRRGALSIRPLSERQIRMRCRLATRAATVHSQAQGLSPKTAWGMQMAKAVAGLQDGDLLTYEPIKVSNLLQSSFTGRVYRDGWSADALTSQLACA